MHQRRINPFAASLAPSYWVSGLMLLVLTLLAWALFFMARDIAVLVGLAALGFVWQVLCQSGMVRPAFDGFRVDMRGALYLARQGKEQRVTLLDASVALPLLALLVVRDEAGRRQRLLVWRDAVPDDVHRALRVYLRWCRSVATNIDTERM